MKTKLISILLALALSAGTVATLVSCDDQSKETDAPTAAPTEAITEPEETDTEGDTEGNTEEPSETSTEAPTATETEETTTEPAETEGSTDTPIEDLVYGNGNTVDGAGAVIKDNSFSIVEFTVDESKAKSITAEELKALLVDKKALEGTEVFRVTEPLVLDSNTKYYGNFATVIAEGGIVIKNAEEIVIKELVVKGNVTVENSKGITFFKLGVLAEGIGINVDEKSNDIAVKTCRVIADEVAFKCSADLITCSLNYFSAPTGIITDGDDFAMLNTVVSAVEAGIISSGKYASIRNCTVTCAQNGVGIDLTEGAYNALVALNVITDVQTSVRVTKGFNCVVLLNSAVNVRGEENTNLYVVENNLGGIIDIKKNNYLLVNSNAFVNDGQRHDVISVENTNYNGNNLHDVNARAEYGANEELLPHTNKDLFIGMERRAVVRDISQMKSYTIRDYIRALSISESRIIIAPGVYNVSSSTVLGKVHSNTTLYAYGVYQENTSLGGIYQFNQSENYTVKGLTMGYTMQSSGQVYVLETFRERGEDREWHYYVRTVTNAGYVNDFGKTDTKVFSGSWNNMFKSDSLVPWVDISGQYSFVSRDEEEGTMIFEITMPTVKESYRIFNNTAPGDVWCCRLAGDNLSSLAVYTAKNTTMEDCVMYGYAAALAMSSSHLADGITLHRYHNTTHSGREIDKETYERYLALEEQYGVDLEVYQDEYGRYRGGASREGSVDATHIAQGVRGADVTSCIFEGMSDDGSNQRASSSRLAGIVKNEDGKTATVYIKGSIAEVYYSYYLNRGSASASSTFTPREGDRIYAYGSGGDIIFDAFTLTAAAPATSLEKIHAIHTPCTENNGICSVCGTVSHNDTTPRDGKCDTCGGNVHVDTDKNKYCNAPGCGILLEDENNDQICDKDNCAIITNRLANPTFNSKEGKLVFDTNYNGKPYTYSTIVYEFIIPADGINWEAVEKYNLSSNEYVMKDKILVDNLSANSGYFTFDNVLIQNARARGVVCKTVNATIKNSTFRNLAAAGTLLSVETTWGESTVAQDITIEGCLYENTGYYFDTQSDLKRASLSVQGLGELSGNVTVSESTLPCRNLTIRGNKFNGTNNNYYIAVSAAQNVTIENNVFCNTPGITTEKVAKAINIQGCYNVKIEGNKFENGEISDMIVAINYDGLTGADVEGVFPESKAKE